MPSFGLKSRTKRNECEPDLQRVLDKAKEVTGINPGETDLELKFSLETVNCLGCCALGPVMEINGKPHGILSSTNTADVLSSYE